MNDVCCASSEEIEYTYRMKGDGIFTDACKPDHEYRTGAAEVFPKSLYWGCPDCDLILKKMKYHGRAMNQLLHPIGHEGGGIAIHPLSPVHRNQGYRFPIDYFLKRMASVGSLKQTRSISVYSHAPCGAARHFGLSLPEQIELTLVGRGLLEQELTSQGHRFEIVPYFHVYWGEHKQEGPEHDNTYMVSRDAWMLNRHKYAREIGRLPQECRLAEFALA